MNRPTRSLLYSLILPTLTVFIVAGCGSEIDDDGLYFACDDDGDCASGFSCLERPDGQFVCAQESFDDPMTPEDCEPEAGENESVDIVDGECVYECHDGYSDCDDDIIGCESDVDDCDELCDDAVNVTDSFFNDDENQCVYECETGYSDCTDDIAGCESDVDDCEDACSAGENQSAELDDDGQCIRQCHDGFNDCDPDVFGCDAEVDECDDLCDDGVNATTTYDTDSGECIYECDDGFSDCLDYAPGCDSDQSSCQYIEEAIYVDPSGSGDDDNPGTPAQPVYSLDVAVEKVDDHDDVSAIHLSDGTFELTTAIESAISIRGGFVPDDQWSHDDDVDTIIEYGGIDDGGLPTTLLYDLSDANTEDNLELKGLTIEAPEAADEHLTIATIRAIGADDDDVVIDDATVELGDALDGDDGSHGADGEHGQSGSSGTNVNSSTTIANGGSGGSLDCDTSVDAGDGGSGGSGGYYVGDDLTDGGDGGAGQAPDPPGLESGAGGDGGIQGEGGGSAEDGSSGDSANNDIPELTPPESTDASAPIADFGSSLDWNRAGPVDGADGHPGAGGGGGGGGGSVASTDDDGQGAGGGGGGSGGCGGEGGAGGYDGGSVFGIVIDGQLEVGDVEFVGGTAGDGGDGGNGGCGGDGGSGSSGGDALLSDAGNGANGGSGEAGTAGAGGKGGDAGSVIAVGLVGADSDYDQLGGTDVDFDENSASAGTGGAGGAVDDACDETYPEAGDGLNGVVEFTHTF